MHYSIIIDILTTLFGAIFFQPIFGCIGVPHLNTIMRFILFYYYFSDYYKKIQKKWSYMATMLVIYFFIVLIFSFIFSFKPTMQINKMFPQFDYGSLIHETITVFIDIVFILICYIYEHKIDNNTEIQENSPTNYDDNIFLNLPTTLLISAGAIFSQVFCINTFILFTIILLLKSYNFKKFAI